MELPQQSQSAAASSLSQSAEAIDAEFIALVRDGLKLAEG